jgi:hypothetical protein
VGVLKTNYELRYNMPIMFIYIGLALTQPNEEEEYLFKPIDFKDASVS